MANQLEALRNHFNSNDLLRDEDYSDEDYSDEAIQMALDLTATEEETANPQVSPNTAKPEQILPNEIMLMVLEHASVPVLHEARQVSSAQRDQVDLVIRNRRRDADAIIRSLLDHLPPILALLRLLPAHGHLLTQAACARADASWYAFAWDIFELEQRVPICKYKPISAGPYAHESCIRNICDAVRQARNIRNCAGAGIKSIRDLMDHEARGLLPTTTPAEYAESRVQMARIMRRMHMFVWFLEKQGPGIVAVLDFSGERVGGGRLL